MQVVPVLQSWKQIAKYVGRTERTVQRWEQEFGFPVHPPSGKSRSSVMALVTEIEEWTRDRPSLVQIRSSARLNREMLMPSHTRAGKGVSRAKKLNQKHSLEILRRTSLLEAQKQLRGREQDLRNQQRALLNAATEPGSKKSSFILFERWARTSAGLRLRAATGRLGRGLPG